MSETASFMGGYPMWLIYNSSGNSIGSAFSTRKMASEYIKMKREQHFFETGSMESAEQEWGESNFRFERVFALTENSIMNIPGGLKPNWTEIWNYEA